MFEGIRTPNEVKREETFSLVFQYYQPKRKTIQAFYIYPVVETPYDTRYYLFVLFEDTCGVDRWEREFHRPKDLYKDDTSRYQKPIVLKPRRLPLEDERLVFELYTTRFFICKELESFFCLTF